MRAVLSAITRVAPTTASVLLCGETGTGKEVLARKLHELSGRTGAFEVVDCGSLSPNLIGSELLGHERGAFTGAYESRAGAFERADKGTVFLDEIGELPIELQPALLGVLERRKFRRIGGSREREVDVRIVSATHRALGAHGGVADGVSFRPDLYFRLAVVRLDVPPLRERREDVRALVTHFARGRDPFTPVEWRTLADYSFPGNARELRNLVESTLALGAMFIDHRGPINDVGPREPLVSFRVARRKAVTAFERRYFIRLLEETGGNAAEAARRSQMDRSYLVKLMQKHGLR